MDQAAHNRVVSFIWGIADDVLRDLFKRGKYPDVILPMCVLRRLDAVLEPTKNAVLKRKELLDRQGIAQQDGALAAAAGQAFYNTSPYTLRDLTSRGSHQALKQDFIAYLDGFSPNVQDILTNFKFRNQIDTLVADDALAPLIAKFLDPSINLSPEPVRDTDGSLRHPATDNHAMGTIFEELVRRFNEDNNEEAGEHWTPRDAVRLMADLVFEPTKDAIRPGAYTIYDGACGTGGMLTLAEDRLRNLAAERGAQVTTMLYGQEINPETYAVCKADMILKGEGQDAEHIKGGAGYSTLSNDAYPAKSFDFMISNPPYGKSWKKDHEVMGGKEGIGDPRFTVQLEGEDEPVSLVTRTSDGQMLFLVNMLSKMAHTPMGSRIAHVHNGSSLFTGDAGQGESNIRRWIMENDWLEAIVALPLNMFYNTGIATYVWVLTNRKPEHRRGRVQLIDATEWFSPLRKNLGQKSRELSAADVRRIVDAFLAFEEGPKSKIFETVEFGYRKVTVERPLRLVVRFTVPEIEALRFQSGDTDVREAMHDEFGAALFEDFEGVRVAAIRFLAAWGEEGEEDEDAPARRKLTDKKKQKLLSATTWERDARLYRAGLFLREKLGTEEFGGLMLSSPSRPCPDEGGVDADEQDELGDQAAQLRGGERPDVRGAHAAAALGLVLSRLPKAWRRRSAESFAR